MVEPHDMGENDTHLLELLSLSLVLDVTPSASQQERDSDSEHTTERSHAAQNSIPPGGKTPSCQPSQATGGLPHPGYQLGGRAPTLSPWPPHTCPQSILGLPRPSLYTTSLPFFGSIFFI